MQGICNELDEFYLFNILLSAVWREFLVDDLDGMQSFYLNYGLYCFFV